MLALPLLAKIDAKHAYQFRDTQQVGSWKRIPAVCSFAILLLLTANAAPAHGQAIPNTFFGMHMHAGVISHQPWPEDSLGSVSLWNGGVSWGDISSAKGVYDFTSLDLWMANAQAHGDQLVYTFGYVPQWASSQPYNSSCQGPVGSCAPPTDVNADGTGTDQSFKDFVTALANHNKNSTSAHIEYWELWNEPYHSQYWVGTVAQLVRMAKDATAILKSVDPNAKVLVPSVCIEGSKSTNWLSAYLAAGGDTVADLVAFHGYVQKQGTPLQPENIIGYVNNLRNVILAPYGLQNRALWDTEASWGQPTVSVPAFTDPDERMGFVARMYILQQSVGVARFFWYQWNNPTLGTMWIPNPNDPSAPGTLTPPGIAFAQVQNWMVGATPVAGCSASGTVWSCDYTRSAGYKARIVWDTAQSCAHGTCTTSSYAVPTGFTQYRTLDNGTAISISGSHVEIGYKPIILEN